MNILKYTIKYLNKLNIDYVLSGTSLYGAIYKNDLNAYSQNSTILIFSKEWKKMLVLFFLLLSKKIVLKLKLRFNKSINKTTFRYKIVGKPNIFTKTSHHVEIQILTKNVLI